MFNDINFRIGDIVRVKKMYKPIGYKLTWEREQADKEIGKCFKIVDIDPNYDFPYELEGSRWLRRDEELELIEEY